MKQSVKVLFQNLDFRTEKFHFLQNNFTYQIYQHFSWLEPATITVRQAKNQNLWVVVVI